MKRLLLIVLPLLLIVGCSQKPIDETTLIEKDGVMYLPDSDEPFSGEVIGLYQSGEKSYSGFYGNGKRVGIYTFYNKDGSLKEPIDLKTLSERDGLRYEINSDEPYNGKVYENLDNGIINNFLTNGEFSYPFTFVSLDSQIFRGEIIGGGMFEFTGEGIVLNSIYYDSDNDTSKNYFIEDREFLLTWNKNIGRHLSFKNGIKDITISSWLYDNNLSEVLSYTNCEIINDYYYKFGERGGRQVRYSEGIKRFEGFFKVGKEHGLQTEWYDTGQKKKQEFYNDGVKDSLWITWYENGQKEFEGHYKVGKEKDLHTKWYENGQKFIEGNYQIGLKQGDWKRWRKNGQITGEGSFTNGTGKWTEWSFHYDDDSDGKYKKGDKFFTLEENYDRGFLDGKYSEWDVNNNGRKEVEGFYKSVSLKSVGRISCKVGKWTWWNYYGEKREESEYSSRLFLPDKKTGVKIGKWIEWYEDKEKKSEFNYDLDGNRDGSWIEWYRNGNKELEWNYKEGNLIGKQYWWYENGQKWIEKIYKDGEIISEKCWNKYGNEKECN
jgi:antitoxin component YwqK of YwqJK toxin-antitoxin module